MFDVLEPFSCSSGPHDARIVFVLEAWGEREAEFKRPLVGASGQEMIRLMLESGLSSDAVTGQSLIGSMWSDSKMRPESLLSLRELWLANASALFTNVFNLRPGSSSNDIELLCGKKAEVEAALPGYSFPPLRQGKYILPSYLPHRARLLSELETIRPNLVVACGAVATWALLGATNITSIRGAITNGPGGLKVLPTYHPASIFRKWDWRPIILADFMKAKHEMAFPEIRRPQREVLINPTLAEIEAFIESDLRSADLISVDIETAAKQITCIGFAPSASRAMVIPFWGINALYPHYWDCPGDEARALALVQKALALPGRKLFQNGLYDLQYLDRYGFTVANASEDSMLLHHSLFPELPKGLGFLGSVYCNEQSWKLMRHEETFKRDE